VKCCKVAIHGLFARSCALSGFKSLLTQPKSYVAMLLSSGGELGRSSSALSRASRTGTSSHRMREFTPRICEGAKASRRPFGAQHTVTSNVVPNVMGYAPTHSVSKNIFVDLVVRPLHCVTTCHNQRIHKSHPHGSKRTCGRIRKKFSNSCSLRTPEDRELRPLNSTLRNFLRTRHRGSATTCRMSGCQGQCLRPSTT